MTGIERILWVVLVTAAWLLLCFVCWRGGRQANQSITSLVDETDDHASGDSVLIAWASQSGTAEQLARHSAKVLQPYFPVRLLPLNAVDENVLLNTRRALFVASTYGEGEPPDNGVSFQRRYLNDSASFDLSHLEFAVLALGDHAYQRFCAFGRNLQAGLERLGAVPLSELTETDRQELQSADSLPEGWWRQLTRLVPQIGATQPRTLESEAGKPVCNHWLLASRETLNTGSPGAPLYQLRLTPVGSMPQWRAGDIVELQPRNSVEKCREWLERFGLDGSQPVVLDGVIRPLSSWLSARQLPAGDDVDPLKTRMKAGMKESPEHWLADLPLLPPREYSAASVPAERSLQLLVRLQRDEQGEPGIGSGWLGQHARIGDIITTRFRSNPAFHGPDPKQPMILVGAGSGLAGLRAHLAERALSGRSGPNWLLFGERSQRHDRLLNHELQQWLDSGHLSRLDRVFSREVPEGSDEPRYVQGLLLKYGDDLRRWTTDGAGIYVCGSLTGMGTAVHHALETILGFEVFEQLRETGRYRRDLY